MNIFILNAGRCGSTTFIKACQHIQNFTALHESRSVFTGTQRLEYPDNHIEADNRLSWFLGRLDQKYGNNAFYVHLTRNHESMTESFARRKDYGIMKAYKEGILQGGTELQTAHDLALDYIETVEANIMLFLKDKTNKMTFRLESAKDDLAVFWNAIGAEGNLVSALAEWDVHYNASV
ncbi:MAG TPA: hypothetical protein VIQ03_15580 [Gammaproteobacteria bacterium]